MATIKAIRRIISKLVLTFYAYTCLYIMPKIFETEKCQMSFQKYWYASRLLLGVPVKTWSVWKYLPRYFKQSKIIWRRFTDLMYDTRVQNLGLDMTRRFNVYSRAARPLHKVGHKEQEGNAGSSSGRSTEAESSPWDIYMKYLHIHKNKGLASYCKHAATEPSANLNGWGELN